MEGYALSSTPYLCYVRLNGEYLPFELFLQLWCQWIVLLGSYCSDTFTNFTFEFTLLNVSNPQNSILTSLFVSPPLSILTIPISLNISYLLLILQTTSLLLLWSPELKCSVICEISTSDLLSLGCIHSCNLCLWLSDNITQSVPKSYFFKISTVMN